MDAGLLGAFPTEVYEQVIDFIPRTKAGQDGVRATRSALCSCALTCRAWLPRSRHLLYQSVTLYVSRDSVRDQDVMGRLTRTLLASSFIADLLHHLTISDVSMSNNSFALALPLMFVCTLPNLHILTIRETILPWAVTSACCLAISRLTAITALTLDAVMFVNVAALGRLLAALPGLHDPTLSSVLYDSEMHGLGRGTAGPLDASRMPRVRRLSMTVPGGQTVVASEWSVLELLAPHIERLELCGWNIEPAEARDMRADGFDFGHLVSLTLCAHHSSLVQGLDDFLSRSRADQLRVVTLGSCIRLESSSDHRTMLHHRLLENSSMLERAVLDADLPRLRSVVVVAEVWQNNGRGQIVEPLEKLMPAVVEKCREKLGDLHRRGLLKVAGATMGELILPLRFVWVALDEGTHAAPWCVRRYGVSLLDAIGKVVDKAFL
ncbi:hypothetical protein V8D89_002075 [Ganoderma adspersum]